MDNASTNSMWADYVKKHLEGVFHEAPKAMHFCDNKKDANTYAKLTRKGVKKATSDSLLGLQYRNERLPRIGDLAVVTDWKGKAQCIIETTKVILKPYFSIDEAYAKLEGDKSLTRWKEVHWRYFTHELAEFERVPRESMIVVCQEFKKIF